LFMRTVSVVLAVASVLTISAVDRSAAADIPARVLKAAPFSPVSYAWSGFYVGLNVGYGFSDGKTDIGIADPSGFAQFVAANGGFPLNYSFDRSGYLVGGQAGYNMQSGPYVWGVEGDISITGIDGSTSVFTPTCPVCGGPNTSTVSQNMDWFGTLRARFGYALGQWLFYGTGGLAFGNVKYSYLQTNVPFGGPLTIAASDSAVEVGWTFGAGVEYGWERWSAKAEYLYYDLGDHSLTAPNPLAPPGVALLPKFQNNGSIFRAGVNYRLN
jgi:outer membrane immunogenic protein